MNHNDNVAKIGHENGLNRRFLPQKHIVRRHDVQTASNIPPKNVSAHLAVLNNLLYIYEPTELARPMTHYRDIITLEPGKRGGKPCIRGMRITVYDVLDYLASGMTPEEILKDFPYLTAEDIQACLSYAADRERHLLVSNA